MPSPNAIAYYAQRAARYDALYNKPERQADLTALKSHFQTLLAGCNVLEIACGTGYWTQAIAETAAHITATDINEPMLAIARQKNYPRQNVAFELRDMNAMRPDEHIDALFGGFIWSHIPLENLEKWLEGLHAILKPGSRLVFTDNRFVEGSSTPISHTDIHGNQFQLRKIEGEEDFSIIKNFPQRPDFERIMGVFKKEFQLVETEYYWVLNYTI